MRKLFALATVLLLPMLLLLGVTRAMAGDIDRARLLSEETPAAADLSPSTKVVTPTDVYAGGTLSYTISLSNSGDISATVLLTDAIPYSTTYVLGSLGATTGTAVYSPTANAVYWQGGVWPGQSVSVYFGVMVSPTVPGDTTITNTAAFSHGAIGYTRTATATVTTPAPIADLSASYKVVTPTALVAGGTLSYTIWLSNSGDISATVLLTDAIPYSTTYVLGSLGASAGSAVYSDTANAIYWQGVVSPSQPISIYFGALVSTTVPAGTTITNTADFGHDDVSYSRSAAAEVIPAGADLSATYKAVTPTVSYAGYPLEYTIYFENNGDLSADVNMTDTMPISTTYIAGSVSASAGTAFYFAPQDAIYWVGSVAPGVPVSVSFKVNTDLGIPAGTLITNTADYSLNHTVYHRSATTSFVEPPDVDLSLSYKAVTPTFQIAGDELAYTIVVRNSGIETATVYLTDTLPVVTKYVLGSLGATSGTPSYNSGLKTIFWNGDVAAGESVTITFAVVTNKELEGGDLIVNTAQMSHGPLDYQVSVTARVAYLLRFPIMLYNPTP